MISGWLIRVVAAFAVVAVILFDAGSMAVNFFTLDSKANEIAVSLAGAVTNHELQINDPKTLKHTARSMADEVDARLVSAEIAQDGVISVRLRRAADTLLVGRLPALERWTRATADARAGSS